MFGRISQLRIASYLKNDIPCLEDGNFELLRGLLDEQKISLQLYLQGPKYVFIFKAKYELEWNLFMMKMLPSLCNNDKEAYELVRRTTWGFPEVIDLQDEKAIKKEIQDTAQ
jgi:hypothetical protein